MTAEAQGGIAGVQFAWAGDPIFFDTRSGEVWGYDRDNNYKPHFVGRLTKVGQQFITTK
jgi:hypothetical protein